MSDRTLNGDASTDTYARLRIVFLPCQRAVHEALLFSGAAEGCQHKRCQERLQPQTGGGTVLVSVGQLHAPTRIHVHPRASIQERVSSSYVYAAERCLCTVCTCVIRCLDHSRRVRRQCTASVLSENLMHKCKWIHWHGVLICRTFASLLGLTCACHSEKLTSDWLRLAGSATLMVSPPKKEKADGRTRPDTKPSWRQATLASRLPKSCAHTAPKPPLRKT